MSNVSEPRQTFPLGTVMVLAATCALYVAMLGSISFSSGGGDASFGKAIASLFFTVGVWIALTVLLAIGGVMGAMPRWVKFAAWVLVPLAGVATFTAIDMCSRHIKWAIIFPIALPMLVAFYALWARIPRLRAAIPAESASATVWGAVLILSLAALLAASVI